MSIPDRHPPIGVHFDRSGDLLIPSGHRLNIFVKGLFIHEAFPSIR
jgi:hypothetical protein